MNKSEKQLIAGASLVVAALWGLNKLLSPSPRRLSPREAQARAIRQQADRMLLARFHKLAVDPRLSMWKHLVAGAAETLMAIWIGAGLSGQAMPDDVKIQIYGRWCGPGVGSGPCIDLIDCACKQHDLAYDRAENVEYGLA